MTPVRPTRARQARLSPISQPQPAFASKAPFDTAAIATHGAGDVLADALIEDGLPRHETEAEASVANEGFDHGEAPASEVGGAHQRPLT